MYASMKGDVQVIHSILKHKPNVNSKDVRNRNALFYAIDAEKGDNADVVLTLIQHGININEIDKESGHSPLTLAAFKNLKNTVRALVENKADVNHSIAITGDTALHFAVRNINIDIVVMLVSNNANIRALNINDESPISLALKHAPTDIYKLLVEEHNKHVKKEAEIVNDLISEENDENKINNVSNYITGKKGKKKNQSGNKDFNNMNVDDDININEDQNNIINNNKLINMNSGNNNLNRPLNEQKSEQENKNIGYNNMSRTPSDNSNNVSGSLHKKNRSRKTEFLSYLQEKKNANKILRFPINTSSANLEIPIHVDKGKPVSNQLSSYISKCLYL